MTLKNKYQKEKQQYSNDGGTTWFDVSPAKYRRGRLLEEASEDCNTIEWREVLGSWFCIEFAETIYRWVDSGTYDCAVGDKYPIEKEQFSHNGGSSWEDTGETRQGEVIRNSSDCPIVYDDEYFTIEVLTETATVYSNVNGLEYRIDNGEWQTYKNGIEATLGQKIQWRGHMTSSNYNVFSTNNDAQIRAFGNINSLYDYDSITDNCYNYFKFFYQNDNIIDVENVILPATTLAQSAYKCMFTGCSNLINTPELPATTLAIDCYSQMFKGCTSLTTAPVLPATTMAQGCYYQMFGNCTSLITPPALPATTLANGCYMQMFANCTSMTSAPTLSATTLADSCYNGMFQGCSSLTTAPALPATTLAEYCYSEMFWYCTSLVNVPLELPALTLYRYCYSKMFKECTNLTTAPVLPATTFENTNDQSGYAIYCYRSMFEGCTNLNYIKMMVVNIPDNSDYNIRAFMSDWVYQVASSGTFVKNGGATWNEIGNDGIPRGWTIEYDGSATRWVDSGTTVCQGRDKYTVEKEQVTTDGGTTWVDTGKTRAGSVIERDSQDCLYASDYLTITSLTNNNNIYWGNSGPTTSYAKTIYISTDDGVTWTNKMSQRDTISIATLNVGDKLLIKGSLSSYYSGYVNHLTSEYNVDLSGNIMSLVYGDNFAGQTELTAHDTFRGIFSGLRVVNAQNLILPATTLTINCYQNMFSGCTSLTTAPVLPATTLANSCYDSMFNYCTSLTTAPELPAETLANRCYYSMFSNCTSLVTAPELPATKLADNCYQYMFQDCTSLTTAPSVLPAAYVTAFSYANMFNGCTNLTSAPELPAETLASNCYNYMFYDCTNLTTAPELPATKLANRCYYSMFNGCTKLQYIKMLATDISASGCLSYWVYGVAASGTFVKSSSMTSLPTGVSGIPSGWTVVDET